MADERGTPSEIDCDICLQESHLIDFFSINNSYLVINDLYHSADECLPGTYRDADISSCVSCDENSVSTAGASSCTACDAGTVPNDDSTKCGNPR